MAELAAEAPADDANDYSRFERLDDPDEESPFEAARGEKDAGNKSFQAADFDGAIARYTEAVAILKRSAEAKKGVDGKTTASKRALNADEQALRVAALSNRAACYLKLRKFQKTIDDCDAVLKTDVTHAKALFRRCQAHKSKGMNEMAYRDVLLLLDIDASNKKALKEKRRLEKDLHSRSRSAIKDRIQREKREAAEKVRKKEEKAKKAAAKKEREEAAIRGSASKKSGDDIFVKGSGGGAAPAALPSGVGRASSASDDVVKDNSNELMKGYKKTKDGRTTSYFTRDWEGEKEFTPKKIDPTAAAEAAAGGTGSNSSSAKKSASAWNSAGTWEEVDKTEWCKTRLKKVLKGIGKDLEVPGGEVAATVSVTGTKDVEGEASLLMLRGKLRFIFDFGFKVSWTVKCTDSGRSCKGALIYEDFTQNESEKPAWRKKITGSGFKDSAEKDALARALAHIRGRVEQASNEFREEVRLELIDNQ